MDSPKIVGHEVQRKALLRLIGNERLPSTVMLAGASGIGKFLVAKTLAKTLFCDTEHHITGPCNKCSSCKLFDSGNLPDCHIVECVDKENAAIAQIRDLLSTLSLRAFSGAARVVIFRDADFISEQVANALLKTLEEPRAKTWFILTCSNPSRLPATLLSRCQVWYFDSLSPEQIQEVITNSSQEIATGISLEDLAFLADGSCDNLNQVASQLETWNYFKASLDSIAKGDVQLALQLSQSISKDREGLRSKLQLLRTAARKRMLGSLTISSHLELRNWAHLVSNLIEAERLIFERNLGANYVLQVALISLLPAGTQSKLTIPPPPPTVLDQIVI